MEFALELVVLLKGYYLDNGDSNRRMYGVLDSTEGALYCLDTAFTYLGSKYFI